MVTLHPIGPRCHRARTIEISVTQLQVLRMELVCPAWVSAGDQGCLGLQPGPPLSRAVWDEQFPSSEVRGIYFQVFSDRTNI